MARTLHEKDFTLEQYEDFYESHYFQPVSDDQALNAHRIFPRVAWALDVAKEVRPRSVLDIGCLEGYAVLTIANHVDSVEHGVGVDLSEDGIRLAEQRAETSKLPVHFHQGAIEDFLKNCDEEFDLILMFEVIEHVKNPVHVLDLIDRVKSKSGTVLISTPDFEAPTFGKDDEQNKCHIRLYTTADEDYEATNKYGTVRKATSLSKQIGKSRVKEMEVVSELINCRYV